MPSPKSLRPPSGRAGSHASPSASPAAGQGRTTPAGSGLAGLSSLATFDPHTSCWRTSQTSWLSMVGEPSETFSGTWPRAGTMRNGTVYPLPPLARRTSVTASGSWRTPSASEGHGGPQDPEKRKAGGHAVRLRDQVSRWPTPTATDATMAGERSGIPDHVLNSPVPVAEHNVSLQHAVRLWPTPAASDQKWRSTPKVAADRVARGKQISLHDAVLVSFRTPSSRDWKGMSAQSWRSRTTGDTTPTLPDQVGGQLNPDWVEWLMGCPVGWTDCDALVTESSRRSPSSSGGGSEP